MASYEILFTKKAARFIRSLPKGYREKTKEILESLKHSPFSYPYRKIRGETNTYRIRIGKYRILYEVHENEKKIVVLTADKRGSIYD